jgi:DNA-binding transcriptional MerR regulator
MAKSPDAFRTISEVADWLGIQAHVLRFWESKFTQVKPIKRAGGRRYYRPADMMLLGGIKQLLHEDGLTIKGVQKILREEGMSHVSAMSPPLDELTLQQIGEEEKAALSQHATPMALPEEPKGVVLNFGSSAAEKTDNNAAQYVEIKEYNTKVDASPEDAPTASETAAEAAPDTPEAAPPDTDVAIKGSTPPAVTSTPEPQQSDASSPAQKVPPSPPAPGAPAPQTAAGADADPAQETSVSGPTAPAPPVEKSPGDAQTKTQAGAPDASKPTDEQTAAAALPDFMRRSVAPDHPKPEESPAQAQAPIQPPLQTPPTPEAPRASPPAEAPTPAPALAPATAIKPRNIAMPELTPEAEMPATASLLSTSLGKRRLSPQNARLAAPLLHRLVALRDSMAGARGTSTNAGTKD